MYWAMGISALLCALCSVLICPMPYMSSICTAAKRCRDKKKYVLFLGFALCLGFVFCLLVVPWFRHHRALPNRSREELVSPVNNPHFQVSAHAANAREDQPRTSVPQLSLRRSANPPGRGPLHVQVVSSQNECQYQCHHSLYQHQQHLGSPIGGNSEELLQLAQRLAISHMRLGTIAAVDGAYAPAYLPLVAHCGCGCGCLGMQALYVGWTGHVYATTQLQLLFSD
jgi:hypothetical protein